VPAALSPVRRRGDKIIRRSQFHIEIEAILQHGNRLKGPFWLRIQLDINIYRLLAETQKQRRGAA
jgi:hypothetical protein